MKRFILSGLIIIASAVTVWTFYMPWARITNDPIRTAKQVLETRDEEFFKSDKFKNTMEKVAGFLDGVFPEGAQIGATVSGYDVPRLIDREESKVAIAFTQAIFNDVEGLDKKCYAVYLLPLFGILCAALALIGLKHTLSVIVMLLLSGAISIGGLYKLVTLDLTGLPVDIMIQSGLWYTMYAFLFIFAVSLVWLTSERR